MSPKRYVLWLVLLLSLLMLACGLYQPKSATRSFATQELLIGLEDMPDGWQVHSGPEDLRTPITVGDSL